MTPAEYQKLAIRTESTPHFIVLPGSMAGEAHVTARFLHGLMGLSSEYAEVLSADPEDKVNLFEEYGDLLWYMAIIYDAYGMTLGEGTPKTYGEHFFDHDENDYLGTKIGELHDLAKKFLCYGRAIDRARVRYRCEAILGSVKYMIEKLGEDYTFQDCMERNIKKLKVRYPDKFTSEAALNRDLDAERKVLEGK